MSSLVNFPTTDGVEIVGDFYVSEGRKFALLLHMMPETKESWKTIAEELVKKGYSCLAIDLRGHGESVMNGRLNYRNFSDAEHQASVLDVEAAFQFLKGKGADELRTIVIGASIGANLAIRFLSQHPAMPLAIALSPGLDYHGVRPESALRALSPNQRVLIVSSDDDAESFAGSKRMAQEFPERVSFIPQKNAGHGTRMFASKSGLLQEIFSRI